MALNDLLTICLVVYVFVALIEFTLHRQFRYLLLQSSALLIVVLLGLLETNAAMGHAVFSVGASPALVIAVICGTTVLGIAVRYVFYMQHGQFARFEFFKPLSISPVVLLAVLGYIHAVGHVVAQDHAQAWQSYEKAAARGDAMAMRNLGTLYLYGRGVAQSHAQARQWYEKAAAGGNAGAMHNLGTLYYYGQGVPKNAATAAGLYRRAAMAGSSSGMFAWAWVLEHGEGTVRDDAAALSWYRKAAASGDQDAKVRLAELGK